MKNRIDISLCCFCLAIALATISCNKQDTFLDKKSNAALAVPTTLADFTLLLNNETIFNAYVSPALGTLSADDLYVTDATFNVAAEPVDQNAYIFAKDIYQGTTVYFEWSSPYQQVYYSNVVLDGLARLKVAQAQSAAYNTIKGEALFFRAYAFYMLVQTFAMPYEPSASATDPGIPLVVSSDINKHYSRGTVQAVYNQIISDLNLATGLLPANLSSVTKPCQLSCNAFLARLYLSIGKYDQAYTYANKVLSQDSVLVDYNTITPGSYSLVSKPLPEDIYHTSLINYVLAGDAQIDSNLYKTYDQDDLRLTYFFRPASSGTGLYFRGSYDSNNDYSGIATDEIYLIRAECSARAGNLQPALNDLNTLLKNRYITGQFIPLKLANQDALLRRILLEREKELFFRGLRWTDLRRLNKEAEFMKTVTHVINGVTYTLLPNDKRYALPIPDQEIQLTGIPQNVR